jgi:hypothetical protein
MLRTEVYSMIGIEVKKLQNSSEMVDEVEIGNESLRRVQWEASWFSSRYGDVG